MLQAVQKLIRFADYYKSNYYICNKIFSYLEGADKPCVVAIDEFQQIGTYAEKNTEALLRTKIQACTQTCFIFAGSKRHLMSNIFNSPSKPFYQSTITLGLEPIPMAVYTDFCQRLFRERGKDIQAETVERVYKMFDGYTWFTQMMMNELYALTDPGKPCTTDMIETAESNVIRIQANSYADLLASMSARQKLVVVAIAKEHKAKSITSSAFIKRHRLPSASSVQSAVRPLIENDMVTNNRGEYHLSDFFFSRWIETQF